MQRIAALLVLTACSAGEAPQGPIGTVELAFVEPQHGAELTRDRLDPLGALAAAIDVELAIAGEPARIALTVGDADAGEVGDEGRATAFVTAAGPVTLIATAFDEDGAAFTTASVDVVVNEPVVEDCRGWLALYGVDYTDGPARPGVEDPVTAMMPINGLAFRTGGGTQRMTMFGDCTLFKSLAEAAPYLRRRRIVEVTDLGTYNYRCINNAGTPPDCVSGLSQHAFGNAIDIASLTDEDGTTYSVKNDWVIDPSSEPTCSASTEPGKDAFLHELICELKQAGVWNIVLTPNYNAAHRDHFHVDLTAGADFIRRRLSDVDGH
jgi:hypothetical protein